MYINEIELSFYAVFYVNLFDKAYYYAFFFKIQCDNETLIIHFLTPYYKTCHWKTQYKINSPL